MKYYEKKQWFSLTGGERGTRKYPNFDFLPYHENMDYASKRGSSFLGFPTHACGNSLQGMKKSILMIASAYLMLFAVSLAHAESGAEQGNLIDDLLSFPAPPPGWKESENDLFQNRKAGDEESLPRECEISAPIDSFMKCWSQKWPEGKPDRKVVMRVTKHFNEYPLYLDNYIERGLINKSDIAYNRAKALLELCRINDCGLGESKSYWLTEVHDWLMMNSEYFREDLLARASQIKFNHQYAYVENGEYLERLAETDWKKAEPLIQKALGTPEAGLIAFGLNLQAAYFIGRDIKRFNEVKDKLLKMVFSATLDLKIKKDISRRLLLLDWPGRDDFYLSLFDIDAYKWLHEEHLSEDPLQDYITSDPEKWIPIIGKFVNSKNKSRHNTAVAALLGFLGKPPRKDALKLLLPWLTEPSWSISEEFGRKKIIWSLREVRIEKSIPDLIWVVKNDPDNYEASNAAAVLSEYKITSAISVIRARLFGSELEYGDMKLLIQSLQKLNGFNSDEISLFLKAYLKSVSTNEGAEKIREATRILSGPSSLDKNVLIGYWMSRNTSHIEEFMEEVLDSGQVSDSLLDEIASLKNPAVDRKLLYLMKMGKITAKPVHSLLMRRKTLTVEHKEVLGNIIADGKVAGGIGAVLLYDFKEYEAILTGSDIEAQKGLLVAARLVRQPLKIDRVASLLKSSDPQLTRAALEYLIMDDGPQARSIVQNYQKGEIKILGARMMFDPGHFSNRTFEKIENSLIEKIKNNSRIIEIFALLSEGYWGGYGQVIVIIRKDGGEIINMQNWGKYRKRPLSDVEFKKIQKFLTDNRIEHMPPLRKMAHDGIQYEYAHITPEYGRRVFMNNPEESDNPYHGLVQLFRGLLDSNDFKVGYGAVDNTPGAKIIPTSERPAAWVDFLEKYQTPEQEPCWGPASRWQNWSGKQSPYKEFVESLFSCPDDVTSGTIFFPGKYAKPVFTPDGVWMVAAKAKAETNWADPNYVVVINLETRTETRVNLDVADNFDPIAYLESQEKVLLVRFQDEVIYGYGDRKPTGPTKPVYYLLDHSKNEVVEVEGTFWPWYHHADLPLQSSQKSNWVWAAKFDPDKNQTEIYLYDILNFKTKYVMTIHSFLFNSSSMWVDEAQKQVFVQPGFHLENAEEILQFPLILPPSNN